MLLSAIAASLNSVASIGLPPQRPVGLRFSAQEGLVEFHYDKQQSIPVTAERLGAFLVSYCVRARIPLPRLSDKGVTIGAHSIRLNITTVYAEAPARDDGSGAMRFSRVRG